jgi:hypothetical protein
MQKERHVQKLLHGAKFPLIKRGVGVAPLGIVRELPKKKS